MLQWLFGRGKQKEGHDIRDAEESGIYELIMSLRLYAGYCGCFPETELLCDIRAIPLSAPKMLVVEPIEPLAEASSQRVRRFEAKEWFLHPERVKLIVSLLRSLHFPILDISLEDTTEPECIWWGHVELNVVLNEDTGRIRVAIGPEGVKGRDAESVKRLFRLMLQGAELRHGWEELLCDKIPETFMR